MDLHWYLRALEEVLIRVLFSNFSLKASRIQGLTGVWVENIGSDWDTGFEMGDVSGLALNVCTDLSPFNRIVPCGIRDRGVGSIKGLLEPSLRSCLS
ncbi:hypothetical protein L2E82_06449 [Cichorium intybus]|uniref:Uncharacterized protein n=1 Tax=Cichorium intybus TaxID=13427 RepID=A0ACB9HBD3_CICIN|nr:hypothetical protein L2E82_06449 [Cichorium intybus]